MRTFVCALALAGLAVGCGGKSSSNPPPTMMNPTGLCAKETRADAYTPPMMKAGTGFDVKFLDSDPAPPIKGTNNWTIELTDASGAPIDGAAITAFPYMPDHGHGTSVKPTVTSMGSGKYSVDNVLLFMPGLWQTTLTVTMPGATKSAGSVVYSFCVDG
jgi:hypothetical protein